MERIPEEAILEIDKMLKSEYTQYLLKKNNILLEKYEYEVYMSIAMEKLLLVALYKLYEYRKEPPTKYRIILMDWLYQAFILFPFRFNISYRWPTIIDTDKMTKRWRGLRDKADVKGDNESGFVMTRSGLKTAKETLQKLNNPTGEIIIKESLTPYDLKIMKRFNANQVFQKWDEISRPPKLAQFELSNLLLVSTTSLPKNVAMKIIEYIKRNGLLDRDLPELKKALKFMTIQAYYFKSNFLHYAKTEYNKALNSNIKRFKLQDIIDSIDILIQV